MAVTLCQLPGYAQNARHVMAFQAPANLTADAGCSPSWENRVAAPIEITESLIVSVPVRYIQYELLTCGATTKGVPRDGPIGSTSAAFAFFMPDFSGFTMQRLRERFDVNEVHVAYVSSPRGIEPDPGHPTNYASNQLRNVLRHLADPKKYRDMYGLRCYEARILKSTMYCYGARPGKEREGILLDVPVPPYPYGFVNPQMTTEYFSNRYGGVEVAWYTNCKNLRSWRKIDSQIWTFLAAWNAAPSTKVAR